VRSLGAEETVDQRIRVVIVDDHALVAESVSSVLALDPTIEVVAIESTGSEGVARIQAELPDVIVLDFQLPDMTGADVAAAAHSHSPNSRIVGITASDIPGSYDAAVAAGFSAWVMKSQAVQELRDAIHRVHAGETLVD